VRRAKARIKRTVLSLTETKYVNRALADESTVEHNYLKKYPLFDNVGGSVGLNANIDSVGSSSLHKMNAINGRELFSRGIMIRGFVNASPPFGRRGTTKIWLVEYNSNQGDPSIKNQMMHNVIGNSAPNILLDPFNGNIKFKKLRTLRHKARDAASYHDAVSGTNVAEQTMIPFKVWIPLKRKLQLKLVSGSNGIVNEQGFVDTNEVVVKGMKEHMAIMVGMYDDYATSSGSNVLGSNGRFQMSATWYFKDNQ